MKTTFFVTLAALLLIVTNAFAFTVPTPTGYVTDTSGRLGVGQISRLNAKLTNYKNTTHNEIAVLVVSTLEGDNIEDAAQQVFNTYKIGQAGLDNGVLFILSVNDRKMRLQTGKGVEGEITDIQSKEIIDSAKPNFRAGDFGGGVDVVTNKIMALLDSRKGQKPDEGKGQQFNKPVVDPDAPTPSHSCDVSNGTVDAGMGDGGLFFFVLGLAGLGIYFWRRGLRRHVEREVNQLNEQYTPPVYVQREYVAPVVTPAVVAASTAAREAELLRDERMEQERLDRIRREERARDIALQEEMDERAAARRRLRLQQEEEEAATAVPVLVPVNRYETYEVERTVNPVWEEPVPVAAPVYDTPAQDDTPTYDAPVQDDSSSYDSGSNDTGSDDSGGGGFDGGDSGGGGASSDF